MVVEHPLGRPEETKCDWFKLNVEGAVTPRPSGGTVPSRGPLKRVLPGQQRLFYDLIWACWGEMVSTQ